MAVLDKYQSSARLTPGLFALLPVATTITTLGLDKYKLIAGLVGLVTAAGGAYVLSNFVGDAGRALQPGLFKSWGGAPSVQLLRLRQVSENTALRDRWRAAVERLTGITLFDAAQEAADPTGADNQIEAAASKLLYLGHEGGVPAVRNEQFAFGYQRNLYGFRNYGRIVAALAVLVQVGVTFTDLKVDDTACYIGSAVTALFLLFWLFVPSEERTKDAGFRYSRQLYIAATNKEG